MEGVSSKKKRQSPDQKQDKSPTAVSKITKLSNSISLPKKEEGDNVKHSYVSSVTCDSNGNFIREGRPRQRSRCGSSRKEAHKNKKGQLKDENDNNIDSSSTATTESTRRLKKKQIADIPEISKWTEEEINQNPFLEDVDDYFGEQEDTASKIRSQSHSTSKRAPLRDNNNNNEEDEEDEDDPAEDQTSSSKDSSRSSSEEGTPVILSREGSCLRVVDNETGEVFFKKIATNVLKEFKGKEPIFIPRLSSSCNMLLVADSSDRELMSRSPTPTPTHRGKSKPLMPPKMCLFDIQEDIDSTVIEDIINNNDNGDDEGDDILVLQRSPDKYKSGGRNSSSVPKGILKKSSNSVKGQSKSDRELSLRKKLVGKDISSSDINGNISGSLSEGCQQKESPKRSRSKSKSPKDKERDEKPVISEGRMRTQEKLPVFPDATRQRSSSRSKSRSQRRIGHETATLIPSEVFEEIFSYLNSRDLESCSRVCRRWKKLTDPYTRGPLLFKGCRLSKSSQCAPKNSKKLLSYLQAVEAKAYRPYTMKVESAVDYQIHVLCSKYGNQFRSSIRHMGALELHSCSLQWKTLIHLLLSFANLKILADTNGTHFSKTSSCVCKKNVQNLEKETKRAEFTELKNQLKKLRDLTIKRNTVDDGLVIYLNILGQAARCVESFELVIGPWNTPPKQAKKFGTVVSEFTKALHSFLSKNKGTMKKIKFSWKDDGYSGCFGNSMEALESIQFKSLTELNLNFNTGNLKAPKQLPKLKKFLDFHCRKSLKKVTISNIVMSQCWTTIWNSIESLQDNLLFVTVFNFHIQVSDDVIIGNQLESPILHDFIRSIHVSISGSHCRSVSQVLGKSLQGKFPRVTSFLVTFEPTEKVGGYPNFESFSSLTISRHFPCLTELRLSDRLAEHNQLFNNVAGRSTKFNISKASLQNADFHSICKGLPRLRVLKIWTDLSKIDDFGITGIHPTDIYVLMEDDVNYSWANFGKEVKANFSNLIELEELSLKGLGNKVTNISAKFGFQNMKNLKLLELWGETKITRQGRMSLRRHLKENETILSIRYR